jgi:glycosyltransferase involved in cell wall biosynthesis
MQYIVYDKVSGDILLIRKSVSSHKITIDSAESMFPDRKVNVWKIGDRSLNVKTNKIVVDKNGEPKGIAVYEEDKIYEVESLRKKDIKSEKLIYKGVFLDHGGYANMNREIVTRLDSNFDLDVRTEIIPSPHQIDKITHERIRYLSRKMFDPKDLISIVGFTPMVTNPASYNVFYTMMEPQTLHPKFAEVTNTYADAVITPTNWNKDVFIKGGIKKPIYVCPLGVDHNLYNKKVQKKPIMCKEFPSRKMTSDFPKFNFITLFGWSYRKGIDVLLKSYYSTFTGNDDVGLIICSRYTGGSDKKSKNVVEKDIQEFAKGHFNPPRVYYYGESTPINELPSVLRNGDCFLWASRGEGFGLPIVECGSMGMPVISTYNSGMTEFLNDSNSYLVHTDTFVTADRSISRISPYYVGQLFPKLGDKVVNEYKKKLRYVYENYGEALKKSEVFSDEISKKYTWDVCASRVNDILKEIRENNNGK